MARWKSRLGGAVIATLAGGAAAPSLILRGSDGPAVTGWTRHPAQPVDHSLRVMTLNLAHGRADGLHQLLTPRRRIEQNLHSVAELLEEEAPDLVALQEADGPSVWSGQFDHVAFVADQAGYRSFARGEHVIAPRTRYGTALISRGALLGAWSETFPPSPPTPSKGYVVATSLVGGQEVDVVSVHLDFANPVVRAYQVRTMVRALTPRHRPLVLMGDLNMEWGEALEELTRGLDLVAHTPRADLITFPTTGDRLDWILASPELDFVEHRVLDVRISDHRPVVAELLLRPDRAQ